MSDETLRVGSPPTSEAISTSTRKYIPDGGGEAPYEELLDSLDSALSAEVEFEPIILEVEKRPGVAIRYSTFIDDDMFKGWRKLSEDKKQASGFDMMRLMTLVLSNQAEAFLIGGKEPVEDDGRPLTFKSPRIKRLAQQPENGRPQDSVRAILAADPHVFSHGNAVLEAAGYGEEARKLDPTQNS